MSSLASRQARTSGTKSIGLTDIGLLSSVPDLALSVPEVRLGGPSCRSDWSRRWLCPGDRVPVAGHLVPPALLERCAGAIKLAGQVDGLQLELSGALEREREANFTIDALHLELERVRSAASASKGPGWSWVYGAGLGGVAFGVAMTVLGLLAL